MFYITSYEQTTLSIEIRLNFNRLKSQKMKHFLFLFIAIILCLNSYSQYVYSDWDSIEVRINNQVLEFPFLGGFNAPQFNEIDLNADGIMDLIIFDRSGNRLSPFINKGISNTIKYEYAPQYINHFPKMGYWLITRDYNCDGKMDLFVGGSNITLYENVSTNNELRFALKSKLRSAYQRYQYGDTITNNINAGQLNKPCIYDVDHDGDMDMLFFDQNGSKMEYHKNLSIEKTGNCGIGFERRSKCWGDFTESGFDGHIYLDSCRGGDLPNPESDNSKEKTTIEKHLKHAGSSVSAFDFNGNNATDIILGDVGSNTLTALYNQDSLSPFINSHIYKKDTAFPIYNTPVHLPNFPVAYFIDMNNDGTKDMIVSTNSKDFLSFTKMKNNILFYKNSDNIVSNFQLQANLNLFYKDMIDVGNGAYPSFFDYNNDGLMDLLIGNNGNQNSTQDGMEGQLALFKNTGTLTSPTFELIDEDYLKLSSYLLNINDSLPINVIKPALGDLDNDGDMDLLIGDNQGFVHYFKDTSANNVNAEFKLEERNFQSISTYSAASPYLFDVDQDSLLDLVLSSIIGRIELYKNLGSKTEPIFNISVNSILHLKDDTMRYQLNGNPNLNKLKVGQQVDVNNTFYSNNGVYQKIARINNTANYIDLIHPFFDDNFYNDEPTTNAVIDYSDKYWGKVSIQTEANPLLYMEEGDLKLILASRYGQLFFYDSIMNNIDGGKFNLVDTNYLNLNLGDNIAIAGADLNNDGKMDLVIGNEAGGIKIYKAEHGVGIQDEFANNLSSNSSFSIYPNPTQSEVNILFDNSPNKKGQILIRDATGKLIYQKSKLDKQLKINTEAWPSGIYFISIRDNGKLETKKLLVH